MEAERLVCLSNVQRRSEHRARGPFRGGRPEYDKFSDLVTAEMLEKRLLKLKELDTFGISLTGRCSLLLRIC